MRAISIFTFAVALTLCQLAPPCARSGSLAQALRAQATADFPRHGCLEQRLTLDQAVAQGAIAVPLADGRFFLLDLPAGWETSERPHLVVSLHGNGGCCERMFDFWHRNRGQHSFAVLALQYAESDGRGGYRFDDSSRIYSLIDQALDRLGTHVDMKRVTVVLHGFSRGSARVFELAALDRAPGGQRRFAGFVADSGTPFPEHRGRLGPMRNALGARGYDGARFWLYCGGRDHGGRTCRGMARMADFVRSHGGRVDAFYRYPQGGHGIFLTGGPRRHSPPLTALFRWIESL